MAKATIPSHRLPALSGTPSGLRSLLQLSRNRQISCSVYSRASYFWTRNDVAQTSRHVVTSRPYQQCGIHPVSLFSTSTTQRLKIENEAKGPQTSGDDAQVGRISTTGSSTGSYVVSLNSRGVHQRSRNLHFCSVCNPIVTLIYGRVFESFELYPIHISFVSRPSLYMYRHD
jgi:hypothetical protein